MRILLLLLLCPTAALALSPAGQAGRAVMERAQCTRCHPVSDGAVPGIPAAARDFHCVDCHTWVLGTKGNPSKIAEMRKDFPDWDRYLENIVHFTRLPDLGSLRRKVRVAFVRRFLDGPFDLRPHLDESMIPLRLTAEEKDQVVAYLSELAGPTRPSIRLPIRRRRRRRRSRPAGSASPSAPARPATSWARSR
ncbi:MAG: hypothetical protein R3F43_05240 [bacterium]